MAFAESIKADIRLKSHMRCCVCQAIGIEIHHIVPQAEGGLDTEENAAPLCPNCHDTYGANPVKRKFIRECKSNWIKQCEELSNQQPHWSALMEIARNLATKQDLVALRQDFAPNEPKVSRTTRPTSGQTLGEILSYIYTPEFDGRAVEEKDSRFVYVMMFGAPWRDDQEIEELRLEFLKVFGEETAHRLCKYRLSRNHRTRAGGGFTEEEGGPILRDIVNSMILLLHHEELKREDYRLEVGITGSGDLWAKEACDRPSNDVNQLLLPSVQWSD